MYRTYAVVESGSAQRALGLPEYPAFPPWAAAEPPRAEKNSFWRDYVPLSLATKTDRYMRKIRTQLAAQARLP
jgi:hypothetical protein